MKAMLLNAITLLEENPHPLVLADLPMPKPAFRQVLVQVATCGICHTELDEIEGRTPPPRLPVVLGHQVVGRVVALGEGVTARRLDERVGVGWFYAACGECPACMSGNQNLCPEFAATGRDADGGYAEYMVAPEGSLFPIPEGTTDEQAAPLLCAGAVGWRSLRLANLQDGQHLGLTGFGASGHLVLQMARRLYPKTRIFVFARSPQEQAFALQLGAAWAGDSEARSPRRLSAIIDTTPVWKPVLAALENLAPGGRLVINAIRKESADQSAWLELDYARHLWMEKEIKSVANVAPGDISGFLAFAARAPLQPEVQVYPFENANEALLDLKQRRIHGAKVLRVR